MLSFTLYLFMLFEEENGGRILSSVYGESSGRIQGFSRDENGRWITYHIVSSEGRL
jgi:hypothetical protein